MRELRLDERVQLKVTPRSARISAARRAEIEASAREVLYRLWVREGKPSADEFYPIRIDRVAHDLCGLRVEEIQN
jgi:hypothetical protein